MNNMSNNMNTNMNGNMMHNDMSNNNSNMNMSNMNEFNSKNQNSNMVECMYKEIPTNKLSNLPTNTPGFSMYSAPPVNTMMGIPSTPTTSIYGVSSPDALTSSYNTQVPSNLTTTVPSNLYSTVPVNSDSMQFLNGFLKSQIGKIVEVDFLLGNTGMQKKSGYLMGLGSDFVLINELGTNDITACDFYTIKFIRILYR